MATQEELDAAGAEGADNVLIDQLSQTDDEVTIEDLRQFSGADKFSDQELQELWTKAQANDSAQSSGAAGASGQAPGAGTSDGASGSTQESTASPRSWKFYGADGKAVENIDALTLKDFLGGKIGYNALGKEEQRALDELIRVAQFGHLNQTKLGMAQQEAQQMREQLQRVSSELGANKQEREAINRAFQQFHMGNAKPLENLLAKYKEALGAEPAAAPAGATEAQLEAAGQQFYNSSIQPVLHKIADDYGVRRQDVENAFMMRADKDPNITDDKIALWLNHEIPLEIESFGFLKGGKSPSSTGPSNGGSSAGDDKLAALEKELAAMKTQLANQTTADVRSRSRNIPNAGSTGRDSGNQPSGSDAVIPASALASKDAFLKFIRS